MFRNLKKKPKTMQLKKKVKNKKILATPIYMPGRSQRLEPSPKNIKKIGSKFIPWDLDQNLKNTIYPLDGSFSFERFILGFGPFFDHLQSSSKPL